MAKMKFESIKFDLFYVDFSRGDGAGFNSQEFAIQFCAVELNGKGFPLFRFAFYKFRRATFIRWHIFGFGKNWTLRKEQADE